MYWLYTIRMGDIWEILQKTGGPRDLRVVISHTLSQIDGGSKKDTSIHSFRALYKMMEDFVISGTDMNMYYLDKSIQMLYDGEIEGKDLEHLTSSIVNKSITPSSSAKISFEDDDEDFEPVKNHKTNMKIMIQAIFALFIIFIPYVYFNNTGASYSNGVQRVADDIIEKHSPVNRIMPSDSFDVPTPFLLHTPPDVSRSTHHNDRLLQTPFINKDKIANLDLNRYGSRERTDKYDTTFDNYKEKFVKNSVSAIQSDGYELHVHGKTKDAQIQEVSMWIEYVLTSVDPAYSPSGNSKLNVLLADTFPKIDTTVFGAIGGLYLPDHDLLYVSKTEDNHEDNVKLDERGRQLMTLVHELSHRVHLVSDPISMDCTERDSRSEKTGGACKERAVQVDTEKTHEYLKTVRDEVHAVVFLGMKSENMTLEEASIYLKMILDMRISEIFEKAKNSKSYENHRYQYAFTNHREFWAEASTSYLYAINGRNFPDRDWMQTNDPALHSLLSEVYSGASKYVVPDFFSFSGKMNPDENDP